MYSREAYEIVPVAVQDALESFAEMSIDPKFRQVHTLRGLSSGMPRTGKVLLPLGSDGFNEYNLGLGFNHEFFYDLLSGASDVVRSSEYEMRARFNLNDFLENNLNDGESLHNVMSQYGLLGRDDDFRWHFNLHYRDWNVRSLYKDLNDREILQLTIKDNGDYRLPTDAKFLALCQRLFWNTLDELSIQRLPKNY